MTHTGAVFRVRTIPPSAARKKWRLRISRIGTPGSADETVDARDAAHADQLAQERLEDLEREIRSRFTPAGGLTVAALVEQYLEAQERVGTWDPKTEESARWSLRRITDRAGDLGLEELADRQPELLAELREFYALTTVSLSRAWLRSLWSWALERSLVPGPLPKVRIPGDKTGRKPGKRRLTVNETREVLARLEGGVGWLPCALLAATGMRPVELFALRAADVDLEAQTLYLRGAKAGRVRYAGAPRELLDLLRVRDPLFLGVRGKSLRSDTLRGMLARAATQVVPDPKRISFYSFRKAWRPVSRTLGVDPSVARGQLGHAPRDHHDRVYDEVPTGELVAAVELVWGHLTQRRPSLPHFATPREPQSANAGILRLDSCKPRNQGAVEPKRHERAPMGECSPISEPAKGALPQKECGKDDGRGTLERVSDPDLVTIARFADEHPEAIRRLLGDADLRARLLEALDRPARDVDVG